MRFFRDSGCCGVTSIEYMAIIVFVGFVLAVPMTLAASHLFSGFGAIDSSASAAPAYPDGEIKGSWGFESATNKPGMSIRVSNLQSNAGVISQQIYTTNFSTGQTTVLATVPWTPLTMTRYTDPGTGMGIIYGGALADGPQGYDAMCSKFPKYC